MATLNKVMLIGNVGKVDIRTLEGGSKIATLSLATSEKYKDRSGEWKEDTTWHNIVVYGNTASVVERYVSKGSRLYVEGRIRNRKYTDRDGNERSVTEIVASNVELLDPKKSDSQPSNGGRDEMGF